MIQLVTIADKIAATYAMTDTFDAWRFRDGPNSIALQIDADTLADALSQAQARCGHGDTLFIRQTHALSGKLTLHCWRIRQGKRVYRGALEGFVAPLKPDPLFSMMVDAFAPTEPWRWKPGADVVGMDRNTITTREMP